MEMIEIKRLLDKRMIIPVVLLVCTLMVIFWATQNHPDSFSYVPLTGTLPEKIIVYRYGETYTFNKGEKAFNVLYNKLKPSQKNPSDKAKSFWDEVSGNGHWATDMDIDVYREYGIAVYLRYDKRQYSDDWKSLLFSYDNLFFPISPPDNYEAIMGLAYDENYFFFKNKVYQDEKRPVYAGYYERVSEDVDYTSHYSMMGVYYPKKLAKYVTSNKFLRDVS